MARQNPTPEQQQRYWQALAVGLALRDRGCVAVGWDDDGGLQVYARGHGLAAILKPEAEP